mmetsp:Transcript_104757/g.266047  ORF Transcript_104757/g.266047 Transcript_104757/m.266047 type:complete len:256 (-) Transcript_104757:42-809(-)
MSRILQRARAHLAFRRRRLDWWVLHSPRLPARVRGLGAEAPRAIREGGDGQHGAVSRPHRRRDAGSQAEDICPAGRAARLGLAHAARELPQRGGELADRAVRDVQAPEPLGPRAPSMRLARRLAHGPGAGRLRSALLRSGLGAARHGGLGLGARPRPTPRGPSCGRGAGSRAARGGAAVAAGLPAQADRNRSAAAEGGRRSLPRSLRHEPRLARGAAARGGSGGLLSALLDLVTGASPRAPSVATRTRVSSSVRC